METIYWKTEYPHYDNSTTMCEYIDEINLLDITYVDGTYAEGKDCEGNKYEIHAGGNGDSYNHKIEFKLIDK